MRWVSASVSTPVSTQPNSPAGSEAKRAAGRERQLDGASARAVEPQPDALGVPAQLPLVDAPGQRALEAARAWSGRQQLGVEHAARPAAGEAARKPMRQLGARIFAKPLT